MGYTQQEQEWERELGKVRTYVHARTCVISPDSTQISYLFCSSYVWLGTQRSIGPWSNYVWKSRVVALMHTWSEYRPILLIFLMSSYYLHIHLASGKHHPSREKESLSNLKTTNSESIPHSAKLPVTYLLTILKPLLFCWCVLCLSLLFL